MTSYQSREEWWTALKAVARSHGNEWAIRDFDGWTETWERESPEQVYYAEFPEHAAKVQP